MKNITIAHSPDADDFFMFWGLRNGHIVDPSYSFTFTELDTEQLNQSALDGTYDVTAISAAAYLECRSTYLILTHGASVSRSHGPVIASPLLFTLKELETRRIGIPGHLTTAGSLAKILLPNAQFVELPLVPFERTFEALSTGEVDAAVLIHEGQLSYTTRMLSPIIKLGTWWKESTGLPLPLGLNAISKKLGADIAPVSSLIKQSIRHSLDNIERIVPELCELNLSRGADINTSEDIKRYLGLYANEDSYDLDDSCRQGLVRLLSKLSSEKIEVEFAP